MEAESGCPGEAVETVEPRVVVGAGASGGAARASSSESRVPSRFCVWGYSIGEKLITNMNQPCLSPFSARLPSSAGEWAWPLAGCTGNHTGGT